MCLFCSADRDLKFLKKCRNIVSRQATCSQITDPAWVGGRVVLQKWDLKILPQNQNPCLLPAVSFLFFSSLSFLPFLHPQPTVTLLSYMSPLYLALSLSLFNCLLHCFCSFFLNSLRTEIIVPYFYHISVPSTEPNTEYLSNKYELHE